MKYRIKKRTNIITGKVAYAVEQQICVSTDDWMQSAYYDERNERKQAIFDSVDDARLFIKSGAVKEEVIEEADV
jgi:hypothetical protein